MDTWQHIFAAMSPCKGIRFSWHHSAWMVQKARRPEKRKAFIAKARCSLRQHPLHHAGADPQLLSDLVNAIALSPQLANARLHGWLHSASAELCTVRPGTR